MDRSGGGERSLRDPLVGVVGDEFKGERLDSPDSVESELFKRRVNQFDQSHYDLSAVRAQERRHLEDQHQQRLRFAEESFHLRSLTSYRGADNMLNLEPSQAAGESLVLGTGAVGAGHVLGVGATELTSLGISSAQIQAVGVALQAILQAGVVALAGQLNSGSGASGGGGTGGGGGRGGSRAKSKRMRVSQGRRRR